MTDVFNAIRIGFEWSQGLTLPEGMIEPGDDLRADFRYTPQDDNPIFSIASAGNDGIAIDGLEVELTVDETKTALITSPTARQEWIPVLMDMVRILADGDEEHLGWRLHIPAVLPVTRAEA